MASTHHLPNWHPDPWEWSNLTSMFFKWVVQPPASYIPENWRVDTQNDGLEKVDSFVAIFGMLDFWGVHPVRVFGDRGKNKICSKKCAVR